MKPASIVIAPRSRERFHLRIWPEVIRHRRFDRLVRGLGKGETVLISEFISDSSELEPLFSFLEERGIPRQDIRLQFAGKSAKVEVENALSIGLRNSPLSFGEDVAEKDSGLLSYFIRTDTAERVKSYERHIVVGPKGSGKSAILRALSREKPDTLVITPEHYATEVLDALAKNPIGGEVAAYATTWKYTLLIEICRRIVDNKIGDANARSSIRRYLVEHGHVDSSLTLFERFVAYLRRISQVRGKIGDLEAEIAIDTADELGRLFKMEELLALIPELSQALRRNPFAVYIDELDQSWNNSDTSNRFLVSLLTAAIQLRGVASNLHVVVFLRSEIFDLLKPHLPQLDKLRGDIETLEWSRNDLAHLILSRAFFSLGVDPDITANDALGVLFSGAVEPSRTASFDYILSRTAYRPREVIQFCNVALSIARRDNQASVTPDAIVEAEETFSAWKYEHIVAENMFVYPHLHNLLERFRGGVRLQSYQSLDGVLSQLILESAEDPRLPSWIQSLEPIELLRLLYQFEVIGVEKVNQQRHDDRRLWDFYDFSFHRPKARPEQSSTFLFHPALWKALDLI